MEAEGIGGAGEFIGLYLRGGEWREDFYVLHCGERRPVVTGAAAQGFFLHHNAAVQAEAAQGLDGR